MRVLMVLLGKYPPDPRVRKESKALIESGHDVRILCSGNDIGTKTVNGAKVRGIPFWESSADLSISGLKRAYSLLLKNIYPELKKEVENEIKKHNIDVVHVHDLPPAKTVLSATDLPVILDLHENYQEAIRQYRSIKTAVSNPKSAIYRLFLPAIRYKYEQEIAMRRADHVLAVVQEAKEEYKNSGIGEEKITIVSNTVDRSWFNEYSSGYTACEDDRYLMTYSGGLNGHHRGLDTAVESQPIIKSEISNSKFRMAGGGSMEADLKELAENLGVREYVEFTGWVNETELPKYIRAADVGVVPHRSNPHTNTTVPHKLFHYMASGIPVLVTETDAVARIVRETDSGVVVPPEDPEAFAEGAIKLADPDRRAALGRNGYNAVEKKYNWKRDAENLKRVYENI
jgi:glycosyltransferase involved in cell wall biosynthesis